MRSGAALRICLMACFGALGRLCLSLAFAILRGKLWKGGQAGEGDVNLDAGELWMGRVRRWQEDGDTSRTVDQKQNDGWRLAGRRLV